MEIYPGFAAAELLEEDGRVVGVATGDMGIGKDGEPTDNYQRGMELRARLHAVRRRLPRLAGKQLMARFDLRDGRDPQTYALGVKELWEVPAGQSPAGADRAHGRLAARPRHLWRLVPLSFGDNLVSYGFVVGLDYSNPWLSPFDEMQRFKTHPAMRKHFEGGRRIAYGARALSEGGLQSIPKLTFPGGALIGDAAGFLNVPKIKGTHTAMKSGMLAAEAVAEALAGGRPAELDGYRDEVPRELVWDELSRCATSGRPSPSSGCGAGWPMPRSTPTCSAARRPGPCIIRIPTTRRLMPAAKPPADRLPEAGRRADLRPALLGVHQQHQPRGEPAGASAAARPGEGDRR